MEAEEWTAVGRTAVSTKSPLHAMMINQRSPSSSLEGVLQNHLGFGGLFSGPHCNLAALERVMMG